jgi:cell shape-determining protein MreD
MNKRILFISILIVLFEVYILSSLSGLYAPTLHISLISLIFIAKIIHKTTAYTYAVLLGVLLDSVYAYTIGWHVCIYIGIIALLRYAYSRGIKLDTSKTIAIFSLVGMLLIYKAVLVFSDVYILENTEWLKYVAKNVLYESLLLMAFVLLFFRFYKYLFYGKTKRL